VVGAMVCAPEPIWNWMASRPGLALASRMARRSEPEPAAALSPVFRTRKVDNRARPPGPPVGGAPAWDGPAVRVPGWPRRTTASTSATARTTSWELLQRVNRVPGSGPDRPRVAQPYTDIAAVSWSGVLPRRATHLYQL